MYHIVICDDEPIFLTQISEMIIDILASMGESCEIRTGHRLVPEVLQIRATIKTAI